MKVYAVIKIDYVLEYIDDGELCFTPTEELISIHSTKDGATASFKPRRKRNPHKDDEKHEVYKVEEHELSK
jgi:hypothetical protein